MKSHISAALLMKAVFFFGSTHKPRTEGSRDVEARVRACAEKQNTGGSGVEEASWGCLIHAANAIEFYHERGTS